MTRPILFLIERTSIGFNVITGSNVLAGTFVVGTYAQSRMTFHDYSPSLAEMSEIVRLIEDYAFDNPEEILADAKNDPDFATHSKELLALAQESLRHKKAQVRSVWPDTPKKGS